jgi:hypothetical protein
MRRASWDSFDAYGSVAAGEAVTLRLPAGPVSIAFESTERSGSADERDLPSIVAARGEELPVEFMGRMQEPVLNSGGMSSGNRMRKRFATVELPYDGDYLVQAGAREVLLGSAGFARNPSPLPVGPGRRSA